MADGAGTERGLRSGPLRNLSLDPSVSPLRALRVLVADDNRDWADTLALLLTDQGYTVVTAYNGREAVDAVVWFQPDAIILDIRMPQITGCDAARALRRRSSALLFAMTAWADEAGRGRAMAAGFDRYLSKTAEPSVLLDLLRSHRRAA